MAKRRSKKSAAETPIEESAAPVAAPVAEFPERFPGADFELIPEREKRAENPQVPFSEPRFDPEDRPLAAPPASSPPPEAPRDHGHPHGEHRSEPAGHPSNGDELRERFSIPQPRGNYTIRVSDDTKLRFLRHAAFYQDQIVLEDNEGNRLPLGDRAKVFLKDRGWRDRSVGDSPELVMTRQLARPTDEDPYARSKSDKQFQDDFIELAQHMRAENRLPPHEAYEAPQR